jgi:hypothetical protein
MSQASLPVSSMVRHVRLHRPPPLGRALAVHREGGAASLADGGTVIATGTPEEVDVTVPAPVGFDQADLASGEAGGATPR